MQNWSTNTKELAKNKKAYSLWRMEQLINFGIGKSKINKQQLEKSISYLDIDPAKKKYLSYLLS